ncbi:MAG: sugar ABC transporter permease [Clostridia bacterium]|nr:sugar ABC transporter permease [Clostridia bacterium]
MSKKKETVAVHNMSKAQWTWHLMKQYKVGYFMTIPFMILFFAFTVIPVFASVFVAFTDWNLLQTPNFVGFQNFITLFLNDDLFIIALKNTILFAVVVGPGSYIMSFVIAWFINELDPKVRAFVTLVFYAPSLTGSAYTIFQYIFSSDAYGLVNGWLMNFGLIDAPIRWFQTEQYIFPLCIIISLWMSLNTGFLASIAGLQGVDRAQYEAAAVDGITNRWQELWYVTLPNMKETLMFSAVLSITGAFGFGGIVTSMAGDPPTGYVGYTLTHHLGEYSGARMEFGYASAISFVLFLIQIGANMAINRALSKVGK